ETIIEALNSILATLGGALDHNYTLTRAFKLLTVPESKEELATTGFASACHSWRHWPFEFSPPANDDEKESFLGEELGLEVTKDIRRVPILPLPKKTLERIREDGSNASGGLGCSHPFLQFTRSDIREHWIERPASYIKSSFNDVAVSC